MNMTASLKFLIGWAVVFAVRLFPWRPPNFEPMLATVMPFSKRFGAVQSFAFGFFGIVLFDAVTSGWGVWTWVTAFCYGLIGLLSRAYFAHREATATNFLAFGIMGTILYDAATGLTVGPLAFHQPLMAALMGQIPFTLMHLFGTALFAVTISPVLYRWVVREEAPAILSAWQTNGARS